MAKQTGKIYKKDANTTKVIHRDANSITTSNYAKARKDLKTLYPNLTTSLQTPNSDQRDYKQYVMAIAREMATNSPAVVNALRSNKNAVVGGGWRLSLKPKYNAIGLSFDEATAWANLIEELWDVMANSPDCHFDASRQMTFNMMIGAVYDSMVVSGDAFGVMCWKKSTNGLSTCVNLLDPARIETPETRKSDASIKNGVEIDADGMPKRFLALNPEYKKSLINGYLGNRISEYVAIDSRTPWGRPLMLHVFDPKFPEQTTGTSDLHSAIATLKLSATYMTNENVRMALQASIAMVVKSSEDYKTIMGTVMGRSLETDSEALLEEYHKMIEYGNNQGIDHIQEVLNDLGADFGSKAVHLLPNESLEMLTKGDNINSFEAFTKVNHKMIASGIGADYATTFSDFSDTSYSAARFALAQIQAHFDAQKSLIERKFAMPLLYCFVEELLDKGIISLPRGITNFNFAKDFLLFGGFISSGKPTIDPLKEEKANTEALNNGTTTREDICAKKGEKYDDVLQQLKNEKEKEAKLGITHNSINNNQNGVGDGLDNPTQ